MLKKDRKGKSRMRKIFLASSFEEVSHLLPKFLEEDMRGKKITFIPTASKVEEVDFFVNDGKKSLVGLGLLVDVLDISTATQSEIRKKITENDYIYVSGGNTFYLLQELRRTGTDKLILEHIKSGKLYIGESAGAVILASNIQYIEEMDNSTKGKDLVDYDSLGILDIYPLPHYDSYPFKGTVEGIILEYGNKLNLCPFKNNQSIHVERDKIIIVE